MAKNKIKQDKGRIVVYAIFFTIFIVFSFICLYPLFFCFINSMKSVAEMALADYVKAHDDEHTAEVYKYTCEVDGETYYTPYSQTDRELLERYL